MSQHSSYGRIRLVFQKVKQYGHGIPDGFGIKRDMLRAAYIHLPGTVTHPIFSWQNSYRSKWHSHLYVASRMVSFHRSLGNPSGTARNSILVKTFNMPAASRTIAKQGETAIFSAIVATISLFNAFLNVQTLVFVHVHLLVFEAKNIVNQVCLSVVFLLSRLHTIKELRVDKQ